MEECGPQPIYCMNTTTNRKLLLTVEWGFIWFLLHDKTSHWTLFQMIDVWMMCNNMTILLPKHISHSKVVVLLIAWRGKTLQSSVISYWPTCFWPYILHIDTGRRHVWSSPHPVWGHSNHVLHYNKRNVGAACPNLTVLIALNVHWLTCSSYSIFLIANVLQ